MTFDVSNKRRTDPVSLSDGRLALARCERDKDRGPVRIRELARSAIAGLFGLRRPAAVARLVAAAVVLPIKRRALGALAHVREKCLEAVAPAITDNDPARSVVRILPRAPSLHAAPAAVGRRLPAAVLPGDPIGSQETGVNVACVATATLGGSLLQVSGRNRGLGTAVAFAAQASLATSIGRRVRKDDDATESPTCQIGTAKASAARRCSTREARAGNGRVPSAIARAYPERSLALGGSS